MMSDKQGVAHTSPDNADPGLMEYWGKYRGMICKHRAMLASLEMAKRVQERLKDVRATGRLMIKLADLKHLRGSEFDIRLRDGDKLYVPKA